MIKNKDNVSKSDVSKLLSTLFVVLILSFSISTSGCLDFSLSDDTKDDAPSSAEDGADGEKSQQRDDDNKQQNQPTTNQNSGTKKIEERAKKSSIEVPVDNVGGGGGSVDAPDNAVAIGKQLVDGDAPGKTDGDNVGVDADGTRNGSYPVITG